MHAWRGSFPRCPHSPPRQTAGLLDRGIVGSLRYATNHLENHLVRRRSAQGLGRAKGSRERRATSAAAGGIRTRPSRPGHGPRRACAGSGLGSGLASLGDVQADRWPAAPSSPRAGGRCQPNPAWGGGLAGGDLGWFTGQAEAREDLADRLGIEAGGERRQACRHQYR